MFGVFVVVWTVNPIHLPLKFTALYYFSLQISKEVCGHLNALEVSELKLEDQESCLIPALIHHFTKTSRVWQSI